MSQNLPPAPYRPQPLAPHEENNWAMASHLSTLAGHLVPFGHILGPLAIWLMKKDQSAKVELHAREAINFQITMTLGMVVGLLLSVVLIGIPILIGLYIFDLVVTIQATMKAKDGLHFDYPMTIRFIPSPHGSP